jgi:putative transposase
MYQEVRFPGEIKSVTISLDGDRWFASFSIELPDSFVYPNTCENQEVVGIDLGIKTFMTLDRGGQFEKIENPRFLKRRERKLRRLQRSLSRKKKESSNWKRAKTLLQVAHRKVRDTRRDFIHKVTSRIVKSFRFIGIEDLNVRGMLANHRLAKSLSEVVFSEARRQLEYKSGFSGSEIVLFPRFSPSSKKCSDCGYLLKELPLGVRDWVCPTCGVIHDRDENASSVIRSNALRHRAILACGEEVRPEDPIQGHFSMKQESSSLLTAGLMV